MNYRLTCCMFLTLTLTAPAAQAKPGGGRRPGYHQPRSYPVSNRDAARHRHNAGSLNQRAFISGKVVLDDGTQLTESANIQTICRGHKQTVAHTDSHGGFSFELGDRMSAMAAGIGEADIDSSSGPVMGGGTQRDWRDCEVLADLPGFTSQPVDLSSHLATFECTDIGHLVLHRVGQIEGLTISATSAMAPKDAQKAYKKGVEKAAKGKWDEAQQLFAKAVEMYPRYAVAWFDLGRVQLHQKDAAQARHSFEQSIAADPKYVNPYRGLADLDTQERQWQPLVNVTVQLLALNPVSFPDAWLRNALGNYYLQTFPKPRKARARA